MTPVDAVAGISVHAPWGARLKDDRCRASALQTPVQREITAMILQRALAVGAEAVVLTGSTVRARRTASSDLDFMVVGERPGLGGVDEEVDVYAAGAEAFWKRLVAGDDYIQWTLRFGCVLHDEGILRAASRYIEEKRLEPSAERKLVQARRGLSLARLVLESGDLEAAREQSRAALTTVARWLLIANGVFPLARDELADQVLALGYFDLAAALDRLIHVQPCREELLTGLGVGEKLVSV
jgi:predicted nucleotidyltransferase